MLSLMLPRANGFLRRALRATGFDIKRFGPFENPHVLRHGVMSKAGIELVIDGGANVGQYAGRLREYGYRGQILSIEPGGEAFRSLQAASSKDASWKTVCTALGAEDGEAVLRVMHDSVSSSLMAPRPKMQAICGPKSASEERVPVRTLRGILEEAGAKEMNTLLKLDVQGSEQDALIGAGERLGDCNFLELELAFEPLFEGQTPALELLHWLEDKGFRSVAWTPNTLDPNTGFGIEFDVILARVRHGV